MKLEDYKRKEPFTVPEGYFDELSSNILKATCGNKPLENNKKRINFVRRMRWIGYAATLAIITTIAVSIMSIQGVENKKENSKQELLAGETKEYEENIDSEYIDNMLESYPIDEYTFYCYLTNTESN